MKFFITFIFIVLGLAALFFFGWSKLPDFLAEHLEKKLKVPVEIDNIDVSSRAINIEKFEIKNPSGSILRKAFSAEEIAINTPLMRYFDQHIVIDEVLIQNVYLGLEFEAKGSSKGNWTTIMGNLKASSPPPEKDKTPRTVLIKKLILTDIHPDLAYRQTGKVQKLPPISHLEFTNVTSEGGIPTDQISNAIFNEMLRSVFQKENLQNMLESILDQKQGTLEKLVEPFKNLLNFQFEEAEELSAS